MTVATIARLELRASLRRWRYYATLMLLVAILATATRWTAASYPPPDVRDYEGRPELAMMQAHFAALAPQRHAARDRAVFAVFVHLQALAVLLIAPLYAASAIAVERERHTLEPLLLTDLRNAEIVLGRWLVRLLLLWLLLLADLPVLFSSGFAVGRAGGVPGATFWSAGAMVAALSIFSLGLGVLASTCSRSAAAAALIAYTGIAILDVALPAIGTALIAHPSEWVRRTAESAMTLRPGVLAIPPRGALRGVLGDGRTDPDGPTSSLGPRLALLIALGVAPLALAVILLRRVGLRAPGEPRRKERRPRRTRRVWADPVAWRELRTVAAHRRMAGMRMAALVASAVFSALSLATWMVDLLEGSPPRRSDVGAFQLAIALTAMIAWLVVALQGSVSIGSEVRNQTFDSLLLTPLTGRSIVRGKLAGAVTSAAFALAFPLAFAGVAAWRGATSPAAALVTAFVVLAAAAFFAAVGLACSLRFPTGPTGAAAASAVWLALCLGIPAAFGLRSGDRWTSAVLASPTSAAYHVIADRSIWPPNPAAVPEDAEPPIWTQLASDAALWTVAQALALSALFAWSRRRIECEYRVRQSRQPMPRDRSRDPTPRSGSCHAG